MDLSPVVRVVHVLAVSLEGVVGGLSAIAQVDEDVALDVVHCLVQDGGDLLRGVVVGEVGYVGLGVDDVGEVEVSGRLGSGVGHPPCGALGDVLTSEDSLAVDCAFADLGLEEDWHWCGGYDNWWEISTSMMHVG